MARFCLVPLLMAVLAGPAGARGADRPRAGARKNAQPAEEAPAPENPFPNRIKAPELDGGTAWLNVGGPISLKDLRGKIVILDFWTYCCINCMHVLPDLKYLERKYDRQLVVIGVHSAKFENEKDSDHIRQAIMRYEIEHPVINDAQMTLWRKFDINSWPSFRFIDPEGYLFLGFSSEIGDRREALEQVLDKVIAYHRAKGTLDETPVRFDLERHKAQDTPLRYPGKLLADEAGDRLFISDSNHNRIVVTSLAGTLRETIGTGAIGHADGSFDQATFDHPQGMALVGQTLYVADTENHLLREVDLASKVVRTLAGTGKQGNERRMGGSLLSTGLNSPWDLVHVAGKLYICMAGPHQLWVLDSKHHTVEPYAGSGREDITDGRLHEAALAQPSGIATDGTFLYVVDSEGSALRKIPLDPTGAVTTVVGPSDLPHGRSLFEFGDKDGVGSKARLQHPLGVTYHQGVLYVADSYNHKIKRVDPKKREVKSYLGTGIAGDGDAPAQFSEPAGLTVARNTLYVADTNNHRIRTVDLKTGKVGTFAIAGLHAPEPAAATTREPEGLHVMAVDSQRVAAGDEVAFEVALALPEGYKLNRQMPITYRVHSPDSQPLVAAEQLGARHEAPFPAEGKPVRFAIPLAARTGAARLRLTLNYGYCREGKGGLCKLGTLNWDVPIEVTADAAQRVVRLPVE